MRSVAYGQLDQRIGNNGSLASRFVETRRRVLTAAQRAEADRLSAQLYAAHYAGRPRAKNELRRLMLFSISLDPGPSSAALTSECRPSSEVADAR